MFFLKLISKLPFPVLFLLSDFLFLVTYHIVRYRRKLVRKNLRNSFPDKSLNEIIVIERQFYHNFCDYGVETIKLLTIRKEDLARRLVFKNIEPLEKYKSNKQSVILLASHQFNWEWMVAAGNFQLPFDVDFVYQPVKNQLINDFLVTCRSRFGSYPIRRNQVAREIVKRKSILRAVAIVADQYPGQKKDKKYFIKFLNQETAFFQGANQLASLTQFPVMYGAVEKVKRGYYEVTMMPIAEPPYEKETPVIIENYAKAAEGVIKRYPSGWLWTHRRWKTRHLKQASEKYPHV
jgi:KDO2-lipid IV(A) lauroyltransferase